MACHQSHGEPAATLVADVPVADVRIDPFPAGLAIGAQGEQVVLPAVAAGIDVLIITAPRVLADPLDVTARAPVADGRIRRLYDQGLQTLLRRRVFRVVQPEHRERRLEALDVLL